MSPTKNSQGNGQASNNSDQADESNALRPEVLRKLRSALSKLRSNAFKEVINAYLHEAESRIAQMNRALSQSNLPELQLAAHTLKSSSALVGAAHLSSLCQQLEAQVSSAVEHRINLPPNVYEMFSQIQREYNRVEIALVSVLAEE